MARRSGLSDLAGLAALGALGYMAFDKFGNKKSGAADSTAAPAAGSTPTVGSFDANETSWPERPDAGDAAVAEAAQNLRPSAAAARTSAPTPRAPASTPRSLAAAPVRPVAPASRPRVDPSEMSSRDKLKQIEREMYYGKVQDPRETDKPLEGVYPEQFLIAPGVKGMSTLAKGLANRTAQKIPEYTQPTLSYAERQLLEAPAKRTSQQLLEAPAKRLTGPSKADLLARDRAARAAARQDEMLKENARRYGLNPEAPGYEGAARAVRERLGDDAFTLKKRGGAVKAKKMASGGMTRSSASKRADGIATKGKTRGKMY